MTRTIPLLLACLLFLSASAAAQTTRPAFWPCFHGPDRDNVSRETGLLRKWPATGPALLWKFTECGRGHATVSVADGSLFTSGDFGDEEFVLALDMDGKPRWKSPNGRSWKGPYPGSRANPTWHDGAIFHMNPHGRLAAFDAASGKSLWSIDLRQAFGARHGVWALSENIVVDGDRVFCLPGGTKGFAVALDRRTGDTAWINRDLDETAAYCSPIPISHRGVRQLLTVAQKSILSLDVRSGRLLWSHPHPTPHDQNIITPIYHDGLVIVSSGHRGGTRVLRINDDSTAVKEVWHRQDLDNCHGGLVLADGHLYGSACRSGGKIFFCADLPTGEVRQSDKALAKMSLAFADAMIYGLSHRGRMSLIALKPAGFQVVSHFDLPRLAGEEWLAHPVICGGRLYLRHAQNLYAYDLTDPRPPAR